MAAAVDVTFDVFEQVARAAIPKVMIGSMIGMAGSIGASRCEASQSSRISKRIFFSISVSPILTFIALPSAHR